MLSCCAIPIFAQAPCTCKLALHVQLQRRSNRATSMMLSQTHARTRECKCLRQRTAGAKAGALQKQLPHSYLRGLHPRKQARRMHHHCREVSLQVQAHRSQRLELIQKANVTNA